MKAFIRAIEYHLPTNMLTNDMLSMEYPDWSVDKILEKTGIENRHIAAEGECSSDLGVAAALKLFNSGVCAPEDIDYILFCTQSPDYFLPTTACIIQDRLGIPRTAGAIDFNQGCSGYVYGLGLAKGLIETGQSRNVLLITAETYSKHIHPGDKSVRTLFGDAAAATLVKARSVNVESIGPFVYGTDGRGAKNLIVPTGGMRDKRTEDSSKAYVDDNNNIRSKNNLYMNGPELFTFTLNSIPNVVNKLMEKSENSVDTIDFFVFHQANKFMLEHLRKKCKIPEHKFLMSFSKYGNTVSSTIPIAMKDTVDEGVLPSGANIMLVGFGVGYSWGATMIRWV